MTTQSRSFVYRTLIRRSAKVAVLAAPLAYFAPGLVLAYAVCGAIDVLRNTPRRLDTIQRYFLGNGLLTWLLSPFNLLMDAMTLPFRNKGVYQLSDLPLRYQTELLAILKEVDTEAFHSSIKPLFADYPRGMFFYKWYGKNVSSAIGFPALHAEHRYVTTIGVSAFAPQSATSTHFGPLRATLRVLYSINQMTDPGAYIEVGGVTNRWCEERLFIFDDTLQHRSCNETDSMRYCLFVDVTRPSVVPQVMKLIVRSIGALLLPLRGAFYRNWKLAT